MRYFTILMTAVISLFAICGCATPGNQPAAMNAMAATVKSGMIKDGKVHVYAFLGKVHSRHLTLSHADSSNFIVNGVNVGGLSKYECMFIEIPPGTYAFSFQERAPLKPAKTKLVTFDLEADQNVFLALDIFVNSKPTDYMMLGIAGGSPGLVAGSAAGAMANAVVVVYQVVDKSEDGVKTIQDMKIVLPDNVALDKVQPIN